MNDIPFLIQCAIDCAFYSTHIVLIYYCGSIHLSYSFSIPYHHLSTIHPDWVFLKIIYNISLWTFKVQDAVTSRSPSHPPKSPRTPAAIDHLGCRPQKHLWFLQPNYQILQAWDATRLVSEILSLYYINDIQYLMIYPYVDISTCLHMYIYISIYIYIHIYIVDTYK